MKKSSTFCRGPVKFICRVILLAILGTNLCAFSARAQSAEPQRVTLNLTNVSLSTLFEELQKQTTFKFFYNDDQVRGMKTISVSATNEPVETVLDRVFEGTRYTYRVSGDQIVIVNRRQADRQVQMVTIKGRVMERDSLPIAGATVVLQGTTTGVATDVDGNFELVVPLKTEIYLEFSFLGMKKAVI